MDIVPDTVPVTLIVRTAIVPAVLCGRSLCEPPATLVAVQLACRAGVQMQFEFEFGTERALAVPAGMRHILNLKFLPYSYTGTFTRTFQGVCVAGSDYWTAISE